MSKLLNQGGFGCVYYPGINCKGKIKKNKHFVSKLQKKTFASTNEEKISNIIKKIPKYNNYFIPISKSCNVDVKNISDKLLSKCNMISSEDNDETDNYVLMKIPFIKNIPFFEIITNVDYKKNEIFLNIIDSFEFLLDAINILIENNIVHFDLKGNNILFNKSTDTPQIIDFGLSIPIKEINSKNIKQYFYIYSPDYYIWPLEVHVICFLLHRDTKNDVKNHTYTLTKNDAYNIAEKFVSGNKALQIYSDNFKKLYLDSCKKELNKYIGNSTEKNINDLQKFYKSWDNYSISIIYLKMYHYLFPSGFHRNAMIINFSQLLLLNISPNPLKRLNINDTKKKFYNLFNLNNIDVNTYLHIVESMDYDPLETTKKINHDIFKLNSITKKGKN
tara:strand:- start:3908 stop:5074 length:1167 start_codon:yes stop_codon:yes gene_type:complete